MHEIRVKVELVIDFSGHADREELLAWPGAMDKKPTQAFMSMANTSLPIR